MKLLGICLGTASLSVVGNQYMTKKQVVGIEGKIVGVEKKIVGVEGKLVEVKEKLSRQISRIEDKLCA